jgi:hypothetical protein
MRAEIIYTPTNNSAITSSLGTALPILFHEQRMLPYKQSNMVLHKIYLFLQSFLLLKREENLSPVIRR